MSNNKQNLIIIIISELMYGLADYIFDIGIIIYLYSKTNSATVLSGVFLSSLLPAFIMLIVGKSIDRNNRKNLYIISKIIRIILFGVLLLNKSLPVIYIIIFLLGFNFEYTGNVFNALLNDIFEKKQLIKTYSSINVVSSLSLVVGPLLASFIMTQFNIVIAILWTITLYALATILFMFIKVSSIEKSEETDVENKLIQLPSKIKLNDNVKIILFFWSIFMFIVGMSSVLEMIMIEDVLGNPSSYYGVGNSVEGIGMLFGSIIIYRYSKKLKPNTIIMIGLFFSAIGSLIIGLSINFNIYLIGAIVIGMATSFCPIGFKTGIQYFSDKDKIGQTFSFVRFIVLISRLFGTLSISILLLKIDVRIIYIIIAMTLLILSYLMLKISKKNNML